MEVRFEKEHRVRMSGVEDKIYPRGWVGDLDPAIARPAVKAGAAIEIKPLEEIEKPAVKAKA